ncbi:RNA pseudouridine synthase [Lachnoclostridium sp. An131]|uniref:RluA family pseudouridine synthase n=1 Tax=Lachnoclostridium sp. An131 TaxID=1965555 RepID=UPI000B389ECD|nr:RluA family pseudouridine synthase [Lachnoclostridium sp. An131]OUQ27203.1 RNA pseudouridine synthase [Lachnoclostridium sp. An131]
MPEISERIETQVYEVDTAGAGRRLDQYLSECEPELTRSYLQKLIRDGSVLLEGRPAKAGVKLSQGMKIELTLPEAKELEILPEELPLDILYEDRDVILVNKPKGMVVHPSAGHHTGTLVNALLFHCQGELSGINGILRPGIVHRIDRDTTGVLIACKNDRAHNALAGQLKEHTITRRYRALVCGNLKEDEGTVDAPIGRHPVERKKMAVVRSGGKQAVTHYRVLERFGAYTYIECRLETGRTHQIRVHMASIGHPLLGDEVYGRGKNPFHLEGQTLHAMVLGFVHPSTGEYMEFEAPLPEYFEELLRKLRRTV